MFNVQLVLGFPLTDAYKDELERVPTAVKKIFIGNDPAYLSYFLIEGQHYLGKSLECPFPIKDLELQKKHVYSLLKKIVPHYAYEDNSLNLLVYDAA